MRTNIQYRLDNTIRSTRLWLSCWYNIWLFTTFKLNIYLSLFYVMISYGTKRTQVLTRGDVNMYYVGFSVDSIVYNGYILIRLYINILFVLLLSFSVVSFLCTFTTYCVHEKFTISPTCTSFISLYFYCELSFLQSVYCCPIYCFFLLFRIFWIKLVCICATICSFFRWPCVFSNCLPFFKY